MDRSNVLNLISTTYTTDSLKQKVKVETARPVFCNLRSVSRSEWQAAGQLGLKPELVATMFAPDYQGETIAEIASALASSEAAYLLDASHQMLTDSRRQLLRGAGDTIAGTPLRYAVYRTYVRDDEQVELYLERQTGATNE